MASPQRADGGPRSPRQSLQALWKAAWWLAPVVFLFWLYQKGLRVWFMDDDFAWLGLLRGVTNPHELLLALFQPQAQGTIRPWSDRGFFLLFEAVFGLNSLPFRICVFVTMAANSVLLAWIVRRITGSRMAGLLAPIFWLANAALITVMSWNSAFDEALCGLFLLSALALFMRWDETGRSGFWWLQLVVFVLGFGALEVNVVYPALAACYAIFVAAAQHRRRLLVSLVPSVGLSIAYFLIHRIAAPLPASGAYAVHVDSRIFQTLATYWKWSLLPKAWLDAGRSRRRELAVFWILNAGLVVLLAREWDKRRNIAIFGVFWFLICLAPMIPLPGHLSDYYLTIPLIGLAMTAAWGVVRIWESRILWAQAAVVLLTTAWMLPMIESGRAGVAWWVTHSRDVHALVESVATARQAHPGKAIALQGVSRQLYNDAISQAAFYPLGIDDVYLTPGSETAIRGAGNVEALDPEVLHNVVLEPSVMSHALIDDRVVVYSVLGDHLKNITGEWGRQAAAHLSEPEPRRVEAANPLLAYLLGPEWYPAEPGIRWMPGRATLRLGGPGSTRDRLLLEGYYPDPQLKAGIPRLSVTVDGIPLRETKIVNPKAAFRRLFDLPASLVGKPEVVVEIEVDRVVRDSGGRDLGIAFGTIAIQ
jgi:hypothetical protein